MPISLQLQDVDYPYTYTDHTRKIARAFLLDETNNIAIHFLHRNDIFGDQGYYETPGGGVAEGETYEEGLKREIEEETGYHCEILSFLGEVKDYYNLIHRENINRFYLAKATEFVGKHFASSGDLIIEKTEFIPPEELLRLYKEQSDNGVAGIVKRREFPMLEEALKVLKTI